MSFMILVGRTDSFITHSRVVAAVWHRSVTYRVVACPSPSCRCAFSGRETAVAFSALEGILTFRSLRWLPR